MIKANKKMVVLIAVVGLVFVGAAASRFVTRSVADAPRMERYLPADTIGFVQVHDLRAQALNIADSEAWREFANVNPTATSLFLIGANHAGILDASYAVALTAVKSEGSHPSPELVLIAEFDSNDSRRMFERRALQLWQRQGRGRTLAPAERYGDAELYSLDPSRGRLAYARTGNLMVMANSADALKKIVDVHQGRLPSLESNARLAQGRGRISYNDGAFGFVDGAAFTRLIESLPIEKQRDAQALRGLFYGIGADSAESLAMTSSFADGRVVERFTMVTPSGGHGLLRTFLSTPPTSQALLRLVPEDATQVFDASIANAGQAFEEVATLMAQMTAQFGGRGPESILQEIQSKTGLDLRNDIISALGSEICVVDLPGGNRGHGALLVNLRDEAVLSQALEKVAAHEGRAITTRDYQGIQIRTIPDKSEGGLHYAFLGGNFIASGDVAAVERIIDTARSGRSLSATTAYAEASASLSDNPLFVYYGSNRHYLNRLGRMLSTSKKEFQPSEQETSLRPSFAFGLSRPDGLYIESYSPLGTFPRLLTMVVSRLSTENATSPSVERQR